MAHVTLQIGAAIVMPIPAKAGKQQAAGPRTAHLSRQARDWRQRSMCEAFGLRLVHAQPSAGVIASAALADLLPGMTGRG